MLLLSFVVILITGLQTRFQSLKLLSISKIDGEVRPEPWIGITEKNKDSWKKLGLSMTIIVSTVTGVVLYFQVYSKGVDPTLHGWQLFIGRITCADQQLC